MRPFWYILFLLLVIAGFAWMFIFLHEWAHKSIDDNFGCVRGELVMSWNGQSHWRCEEWSAELSDSLMGARMLAQAGVELVYYSLCGLALLGTVVSLAAATQSPGGRNA